MLPVEDGVFYFGVVGNDATRCGHRRLIQCDGSNVGAGELIVNAFAIRIAAFSKAFGGLHAMVLVECGVREFSQ